MATNREKITQEKEGRLGSLLGSDAKTAVAAEEAKFLHYDKTESATGSTSDEGFAQLDKKIRIVAVKFIPKAASTASNTDYKTVTLEFDDAAAGSNTVVATATTTSGWAEGVPASLTVTQSVADIAADKLLRLKIALSGAGQVVSGRLQVKYLEV